MGLSVKENNFYNDIHKIEKHLSSIAASLKKLVDNKQQDETVKPIDTVLDDDLK